MTETLTPKFAGPVEATGYDVAVAQEADTATLPRPASGPASLVEAPRKVTVADVLERAADLLGEYGWCQGRLGSRDGGSMCLVGALRTARADLGDDFHAPLYDEWNALGYDPNTICGPADFNDAPGRTKTEVIQALRAAASSARTKEEA